MIGSGVTGALNLSAEDAAFIAGLTLTTCKRISSPSTRPILDKFLQITSHVNHAERHTFVPTGSKLCHLTVLS